VKDSARAVKGKSRGTSTPAARATQEGTEHRHEHKIHAQYDEKKRTRPRSTRRQRQFRGAPLLGEALKLLVELASSARHCLRRVSALTVLLHLLALKMNVLYASA